MSIATRIRFATLGATALPVCIIVGANWLGGDPLGADAAGPPDLAMMNVVNHDASDRREHARMPASSAALGRLIELDEWEFETPPLHVTGFSESTDYETVLDSEGLPAFNVQAVLAAEGGNTALLDGKAYRVGDAFQDSGWSVIEISAATRSVSLGDRAGRIVTQTVPIKTIRSSEPGDGT